MFYLFCLLRLKGGFWFGFLLDSRSSTCWKELAAVVVLLTAGCFVFFTFSLKSIVFMISRVQITVFFEKICAFLSFGGVLRFLG